MLVRQTWGTHYIDFLYDESGTPYSLVYDGVQYYYVKNVQGDVVQIRSVYGTLLVEYSYDAWGNVLSITGSYANTLGVDNPIRYRSYYYDFETGFYYLNSRYYDPAVKRFINADVYINANGAAIGFNMYSYCNNNPINNIDSEGTFLCTAIGAIVGGICGAAAALIEGKTGKEVWTSAANGAVAGAISGLAADIITVTGGTAAVVVGVYAAAGAIGSADGSLVESSINGKDMSSDEVRNEALKSAAWGGAFGALGGAMTGSVTSMMDDVVQHAGKKALAKGITVWKAVKKTVLKELRPRNLVESVAEEFGNNFNSWYTEFVIDHAWGND